MMNQTPNASEMLSTVNVQGEAPGRLYFTGPFADYNAAQEWVEADDTDLPTSLVILESPDKD